MKPILFNENATEFNTNGIGRLDCTACKVTEEKNGIYELEMSIAETALHADEITITSIIGVIPSDGADLQPFRVYKITKPINGIFKVMAQHISYQLSMIPCMPFSVTASASACAQALAGLKSNATSDCPFTFETDVTTVAPYKQTVPSSIRSRLGGVEGSIIDQFGGEWEFDNYRAILHKNRGVTTPTVSLRYGKNITDLTQEENISNTITGIVPYWADSEGETVITLPEKVIESAYASRYPFKRTIPYDFSSRWQEAPTEAQLRAAAEAYINQTGMGIPTVSIKVSFVALWQTEEYKDIAPLEHVKLCDLVNVEFEKYGISSTAKIVKTVYDVLREKYDSVEIGSLRANLATTINDQNNATTAQINNKFAQVGQEIDNATSWLTSSGGYVIAVKNDDGSWKELLFMDTDDVDTAVNVLRINENGIGFSSNGVAGPYTQAWTLDGRLVIGGTNVPSITVYDNSDNIIFQASADAMIWNTDNSSMSADGTINMKNGQIVEVADWNNGTRQIILNITGLQFQYIVDHQVKYSGSLTVADIFGNIGTLLSSTGALGLSTTGDMWMMANSIMMESNTILLGDPEQRWSLNIRRPGMADGIGHTGTLRFYDGNGNYYKIDTYNGIVTYMG